MRKVQGLRAIVLFISIAGIAVSASLFKEDVLSTAHTLFYYFPAIFGVIPAITYNGTIYQGIFVSVMQIVGAVVGFNSDIQSRGVRWLARIMFAISLPFDAWTDIVHRSNEFSGNIWIATVTTLFFYTFGSEIMQSLCWLLVVRYWRTGIAEILWTVANVWSGLKSIGTEWANFRRGADNFENRNLANRANEFTGNANTSTYRPSAYSQPSYNAQPVVSGVFERVSQNLKNARTVLDDKLSNVQPVARATMARPAPKPVPSAQGKMNFPEPTYHPISMNKSADIDDDDDF